MKSVKVVIWLMLCVMVLSACSGGGEAVETNASDADTSQDTASEEEADTEEADTTESSEPIELNIGWSGDVAHWDPYNDPTVHQYVTGYLLYDTLIAQDLEGNFIPQLATEWSFTEDFTEWSFKLRDDVTFSNGEPFNAECVKTSFDRLMTETLAVSTEWKELTDVIVVGDYEVKLIFSGPNGGVLFNTAMLPMLPAQYFAEVGVEGITINPVGSGAFVLSDYEKGQKMEFTKRQDYWGDQSDFDKITFYIISEGTTRIAGLQTGDVNFAYSITPDQFAVLADNPTFAAYELTGTMDQTFFGVKCDEFPFDDVRVRTALSLALDRQELVEQVVGVGDIATSCFPKGCLGYDESIAYPARDVALAQQLLEESGYNGEEIVLICPIGWYPKMQEQAEAMIAQLSEAGFNIKLEMLEPAGYLDARNVTGEYNLFFTAMSQPQGYPNVFLTQRVENDANLTGYVNEHLNSLIAEARLNADLDILQGIYAEVNQIMTEEYAPHIWLYQYAPLSVYNADELVLTDEAMIRDGRFHFENIEWVGGN